MTKELEQKLEQTEKSYKDFEGWYTEVFGGHITKEQASDDLCVAYDYYIDNRRLTIDNANLEKENAELKKKNLDTQDAVTMQMYTNKANKEIADRQLTKAKEIIKKMYTHVFQKMDFMELNDYNVLKAEVEQFLKEIEK